MPPQGAVEISKGVPPTSEVCKVKRRGEWVLKGHAFDSGSDRKVFTEDHWHLIQLRAGPDLGIEVAEAVLFDAVYRFKGDGQRERINRKDLLVEVELFVDVARGEPRLHLVEHHIGKFREHLGRKRGAWLSAHPVKKPERSFLFLWGSGIEAVHQYAVGDPVRTVIDPIMNSLQQ